MRRDFIIGTVASLAVLAYIVFGLWLVTLV